MNRRRRTLHPLLGWSRQHRSYGTSGFVYLPHHRQQQSRSRNKNWADWNYLLRPSVIATFWITLLFAWSELSAQQSPDVSGYTVDENRIIVKGLDHWRFWETPEGVGVIDEDGNAHPRFLRRDINAVANAVSFMNVAGADTTTGGISSVGFGHRSADKTLPFIIDGDMPT